MFYTKEMLHKEFAEVTLKDERNALKPAGKKSYKHRIEYLKALKEDMIKVPKNFSNLNLTTDQLQNLIDDWSAPKPIDAFYKRIFNMTYAEKKAEEEAEYFDLSKKEKVYNKKRKVKQVERRLR